MNDETYRALETQLIQALNLALHIEETSYTHSFDIRCDETGFFFIPRLPASFVVDTKLYQQIYAIASALLYPTMTLLKQNGAYFVPNSGGSFSTQRALYYPWQPGVAERLEIDDIESFSQDQIGSTLPIMENFDLDISKITHIGIAGQSGSGKSTFLIYLLHLLKDKGNVTICDPKLDTPSRFARQYNLRLIAPVEVVNKNDFVSSVNAELSSAVDLIHTRQRELFENPEITFTPEFLVIDELLALTENVSKSVSEAFQGLLSTIALLGRATGVHLILLSQRFDARALSTSTRDQLNMVVQLGAIDTRTTNFLLPDLDVKDIVVPQGIGAGLIQVIDGVHPSQPMPLLTPSFKVRGGEQ
ncbi:DNA segregation ATPase FtsK/SpoIIIE or related protein (FtsK) [Fructobacillus fructosus]|uniref:AAA family ATPase n=1 Tax=Fructobacillus fructosus TaxID=1631 RepID=UPI002D99C2D1|nr:DNA segregation ATPase FtsK/SpoIIIE or related protein (FtsK) [Fructobacillus fructosus]